MNELTEVLMANDSHNFFSHALHVLQKLLKLRDELSLSRLEGHTLTFWVKIDGSLDTVLLLLFCHLSKDQVGTLLIDLDLGFNNHVINQSN